MAAHPGSGVHVSRPSRAPETRTGPAIATLPAFPALRPLQAGHLPAIRAATAGFASYSDFQATSLWAWSAAAPAPFRVGRWGANLVVELADYLDGDRFLTLLGDDRVDEAASALVEGAEACGAAPDLRLVPEVVVDRLDRRRWLPVEQPDHADYVFDLDRQARMEGQAYKNYRNSYRRFERLHAARIRLDWVGAGDLPALAGDLLAVFDSWAGRASQGAAVSDAERVALGHLARTAPRVSRPGTLTAAVVRDEGRPVAFAIVECSSGRVVHAHFKKVGVCAGERDLDAWLSVHLARRVLAAGYRWINEQQDLGIPGLRAAKRSRRPTDLLRKYRV